MPNDHEHAVCGEVTQADREAAAKIYDLLGFGPCQHIIDGMEDDIGVVAIVARHRIASVAALTAEVERVRAEAIEACAKVAENMPIQIYRGEGREWSCKPATFDDAATAIRALAGEGV